MKYDLQIIVPLIEERLPLFQKFGLFNIKNRKVLLHGLVETKSKEFYKGWPEGVDIEIIEFPDKNENFRVYNFLYGLCFDKERSKDSKWILKLDDDSLNNVDLLVDLLDKRYDYRREYYICGDPIRKEMNYTEALVVKKCKLLEKIDYEWTHEWEFCAISQGAFRKIISNEDCKKLFFEFADMNKEDKKGYTDQILGCAAKLCDLQPTPERFIKYDNANEEDFKNFAYKGKNYNENFAHLHPVRYENLFQIGKGMNVNFSIKIIENEAEILENENKKNIF